MNINMTFFGQMLSFVILVWFTMKFIWPPLNKAIEERQKKIAEGLAAADRSQKDLALAREKVNEELKTARSKANEIIEQAHQRATQIIEAAKQEGIAEGARQKALAESEITSASNRAREELRQQVSTLAVAGAEKLLGREVDQNTHKALLDQLANEISA